MPPELKQLIELLGAEHLRAMLTRFGTELDAFEGLPRTTADAKTYAHRLISQSGMLGFHALSQAARQFESAASAELLSVNASLRSEIVNAQTQLRHWIKSVPTATSGSSH